MNSASVRISFSFKFLNALQCKLDWSKFGVIGCCRYQNLLQVVLLLMQMQMKKTKIMITQQPVPKSNAKSMPP